jgi:hypothetical protein
MPFEKPPAHCAQCGAPVDDVLCDAYRSAPRGLFAVAYRPLPQNLVVYLAHIAQSRLFWGLLLYATVPILLGDFHMNVVDGMMVYFSLFWFFIFYRNPPRGLPPL